MYRLCAFCLVDGSVRLSQCLVFAYWLGLSYSKGKPLVTKVFFGKNQVFLDPTVNLSDPTVNLWVCVGPHCKSIGTHCESIGICPTRL